MLPRLALSILLLTSAAIPVLAGDQAPPWLQQAAQISVPTYDKNVKAVVLVNDCTSIINDEGRVTKSCNYAVRILQREGRDNALAAVAYTPDTGKVKDMDAWLIRSNGVVKRYGKEETLDALAQPNDVYNELRVRAITASDDADGGTVFGYSYTTEDRSVFSQDEWDFQSAIPVISSRYTLVLPNGWRAESVTFNHAKVEPKVSGTSYTWELGNLAAVPEEPMSPSLRNMVARVAIGYFPPANGQTAGVKTFANWADVSAWMSELEDPQVVLSEPLTAKARELTANAKTEYEKIQAIGSYVQKVQYISIQTGLGRGGGYRPHSSAEVFAKSYGDCKDKANLMRAMLKVVGIDALPVSIYSGDPNYVRSDWPSPQQFNHCIIAVKVSDETHAATIIQHAKLGRLLIFDPTAEETPVGDLPFYLQGSLALLDSKDADALVQMPITPMDMNLSERSVDLQLDGEGSLTGAIELRAKGQSAAGLRSEFRALSRPGYNTLVERWLATGATGSRVSKVEPLDEAAQGRFGLNISFAAPGYAQLMQNRLLVFKPAIVERGEWLSLNDLKRSQPVVLTSSSYSETVRVKLPDGFEVDELPDPVKLDTAFGIYNTSYDVKDGQLTFKRSLIQRAMTVPVEQYAAVRSFFEKMRAAEQAPVVLARK